MKTLLWIIFGIIQPYFIISHDYKNSVKKYYTHENDNKVHTLLNYYRDLAADMMKIEEFNDFTHRVIRRVKTLNYICEQFYDATYHYAKKIEIKRAGLIYEPISFLYELHIPQEKIDSGHLVTPAFIFCTGELTYESESKVKPPMTVHKYLISATPSLGIPVNQTLFLEIKLMPSGQYDMRNHYEIVPPKNRPM